MTYLLKKKQGTLQNDITLSSIFFCHVKNIKNWQSQGENGKKALKLNVRKFKKIMIWQKIPINKKEKIILSTKISILKMIWTKDKLTEHRLRT